MTAEEFAETVVEVKDESNACVLSHPEFYSKGGPYYSWDNAAWHQAVSLDQVGLTQGDKWQLPPNSPDMHKVIEHVVGNVKRALRDKLADNANITSAQQLRDAFVEVFYEEISKDSIRKDIDSLPNTYKHIHHTKQQGGSGGDWAQARYR